MGCQDKRQLSLVCNLIKKTVSLLPPPALTIDTSRDRFESPTVKRLYPKPQAELFNIRRIVATFRTRGVIDMSYLDMVALHSNNPRKPNEKTNAIDSP
jgi:hypothetical protein